ncbi:MAG TPA: ABC transporter permease [Clostridia bacterium]|nr:ABC transporter permease [Clostridia bacterium]
MSGIRRFPGLLRAVCILWIIVTLNFIIMRLVPGDVVVSILGESEYFRLLSEYPQKIEETRVKYGLDKPLPAQYLLYLKSIATLDFGYSYVNKQPVAQYVAYHAYWTLLLTIPALALSALLGGLLGLWAGWRRGGVLDRLATPFFILMSTVPSNCVAILCLVLFAFQLGWFPISGMSSGGLQGLSKWLDILWHMTLPLIILTVFRTGSNFLYMKSYATRIRGEEYILTAVSKGLTDRRVLIRHALRNVVPPYVSMLCMQFGRILSGSMMVEVVFSWRGMGMLMRNAAASKDFPVLQLCMLLIALCVMAFNLLADRINQRIDPRTGEAQEQ